LKNDEVKMDDKQKTTEQLLAENADMRKRIVQLEIAEVEHLKMEESYRESAEKFRLVFENAFDGISVFEESEDPDDPENRILVECNARYAEMAGRSREELLRIGRVGILTKSFTPECYPAIMKGIAFRGMFTWLRPDGKDNINEYTAVPIIIKGKKFTIGIDRDITERKRMEEALQQAQIELERRVEERTRELVNANAKSKKIITAQKLAEEELRHERNILRTLIDNLPDSVYVKDTKSCKTIANEADVHNMGGQSEAEVLGKNDFDFYSADVAAAFYADDQSVIQTGQPILNKEEFFIDKEGKEHWLLTSKLPLMDEHGRITSLVGVGREITEQKRIEEALRHEKTLLDALMDNIPDSIYFKDRQCRLLRMNRKEMRDLNMDDMSQIVGKTDIDLWGEEFGRKTFTDEQRLMESGEPIIGLIESRQLEDGQTNWTWTTKVPLRDDSSQIVGLVGITRDINDLMNAQTARDKLIKELQNALADVKTLSGLVPICANCKQIRDDKGFWTQVEFYIQQRSEARFTHGICPDCMKKLYPDFLQKENE
jgi:PAS domain S-box-containing protein